MDIIWLKNDKKEKKKKLIKKKDRNFVLKKILRYVMSDGKKSPVFIILK
jgi:ribosomal protein S7